MSQIPFFRMLLLPLLTLLAVPTLSNEISSEGECCFKDRCANERLICADVNDTVFNSCNEEFLVTDQCILSKRCCYTDFCSKERICAEDGMLRDSCGTVSDVATNCTLSKREGEPTTRSKSCCFTDTCSKERICAEDSMLTDSCAVVFDVTPDCKLSKREGESTTRCCFTDLCSEEKICAEDGMLKDSCGKVFDVTTDCKLSRRENDDNDMNDASDGVTGQQTADPESSSSPSKPRATVTPPPEAPQTTPSTQSSGGTNGTEGTKRCCFKDTCSGERICTTNGVLRDTCNATFDVALDCSLTRRENAESGSSTGSPESDGTISAQATPEAPASTPSALPSATPSPSIAGTTSEDDSTISITSEAVCIHIRHLSHLPSSALLYQRHVLAHVLCDSSASCATPGHMVVYKGESMRMSGYCQIVGCQRERALVNSPRYSRGGRVDSHSAHLVFTMLAARFETRVEEIILAGLVRVGL